MTSDHHGYRLQKAALSRRAHLEWSLRASMTGSNLADSVIKSRVIYSTICVVVQLHGQRRYANAAERGSARLLSPVSVAWSDDG